ncbi:MAG: LysR family transcriptional regulator [Burkholderiales bacterium]|nr:LysR family transcriptional regulator [Burkholderiales bacterium]
MTSETYRLDRLRLRHLRLLELVAQLGSLGNAARALGVSQPACTLLLRELEAVFGARLVERGAKGGRLTTAGARALERLAIALASVERAVEAARTPTLAPLLRVGCIQVVGSALLPAVFARLARHRADLRIRLREGRAVDLMASLAAGELDCVIGWMDAPMLDPLPVAQLAVFPLRHGRMQVVAAHDHPLTRRPLRGVEPLLRWPWIVPPAESRTHAAFRRLFLQHGVAPPAVAVECAALHTTLHVVSATRHLAVAPDAAVSAYARRGIVKALKGPALDAGRDQVSLAIRRDSEALPAVRAFRDAVLSLAALL